MADQLRHDFIGALTPHISALMAESTVFSRAYCASPLCVPARGAFFTGRYPNETGCRINPWNPRERRYGEVQAGTPNLYTLLEGTWDSWHTGKQHLYTVDQFDRQPASATRWLSLENGYDAFLHARGVPAPGGGAYRAALPEVVEGSVTRVPRLFDPYDRLLCAGT